MKKLLFGILFLSIANFANAQWVQTNGPEGGIVTCMAASGSNVFVGIENEGLYRSTDYGQTWMSANNGLIDSIGLNLTKLQNVSALTINGNFIYAAVQGSGKGMYISKDNGQSWVPTKSPLTSEVTDIVIKNDTIFVSTLQQGVLFSSNNGQSWTSINNGLTTKEVFTLAVCGNNLIAGCPAAGIFISKNNGQSWTLSNYGLTNTMVFSLAVSGNNIYAGTYLGTMNASTGTIETGGVYLSTDNGQSWTPVNTGLSCPGIVCLATKGDSIFAGAYTNYSINAGGIIDSDTNTFQGGLFVSTDGQSWSKVASGFNYDINCIVSTGAHVYAGTQGGGVISSNDNGKNWILDNSGIINSTVQAFTYEGDSLFSGTNGGGIFLSTDNGQNWLPINEGLNITYVRALAIHNHQIFAGTGGGGVFISKDKGQSWTPSNNGLTNGGVTALAVSGKNILAGTQGGMYRSTDDGQSWSSIDTGLTNTLITAIVTTGNNVFVGTESGDIFLSNNNGQNWSEVNTGFKVNNSPIISLAASGEIICALTDNKIIMSYDNGQNWVNVSKWSDIGFSSVISSGDTLVVSGAGSKGTYGGFNHIYISTNNGQKWSVIGDSALGRIDTWDDIMSMIRMGNNLFLGSHGKGVLTSSISNMIMHPVPPSVESVTQPTCAVPTGTIILSGLPAGNWTINPGNVTGSSDSITISGLTPGWWTFTVTDSTGYTTEPSPLVTLDTVSNTPATPTVGTITQPNCSVATGSVDFSGLPSGNWTINPGDITGSTDSTTISNLSSGTYNFIVTNDSGCNSIATSDVVINTQPSTPAAPTVGTISQPTCSVATGSVILSGLASGNWTINPGNITGSTDSTTISGLSVGTYNFTVYNAAGCISDSSADVVIQAQPETPTAPTVSTITQPTCSVATGSVVLSGLPSENWIINPGNITGSTSTTTVSGLSAGTYNFTVTNDGGCTSDASADVLINAQSDTPAAPTISLLNDTTLHSNASTGNQWYNQIGLLSGATNQDYIAKASGDYYAIVTLNGCSSDTSNVITVAITGVTLYGNQKTIKIYPNPFTRELIIENKGIAGDITFEIFNSTGKIIYKGVFADKTRISTSGFAPGVYVIKFERQKSVEYHKVIKN